jgi:hypothetical protein
MFLSHRIGSIFLALSLLLLTPKLNAEDLDGPLVELDRTQATKAMPDDSLRFRETYGSAEGAVKEMEFFDSQSNSSPANPVLFKVVGNELVLEPTEMNIMRSAIFPVAPKVHFPLTFDIKFRTEMDMDGSVELNLCADSKITVVSIRGKKVLVSGTESLNLDTDEVRTLRFIFDEEGRGRVYVVDGEGTIGLARREFNGNYTTMDLRLYGAKLFIQEVSLYDQIP